MFNGVKKRNTGMKDGIGFVYNIQSNSANDKLDYDGIVFNFLVPNQ